jgi:hypothetical protein
VKSQERGWPNNDGGSLDTTWTEKQRPEAEQDSVERREIGRAAPRPVDDQELLLHEETVGGCDNRSCATGSQELGERGQQMCQEDE